MKALEAVAESALTESALAGNPLEQSALEESALKENALKASALEQSPLQESVFWGWRPMRREQSLQHPIRAQYLPAAYLMATL